MLGALFFWKQTLRVAGPDSPADVVARLQAELSAGRFGLKERLAGELGGSRLKVRKFSMIGRALDVVEFEGELRGESGGTVIEGVASYSPATSIQFVGMLAIGAGMVAIGIQRGLAAPGASWELFGAGVVVTIVALAWIVSSYSMKGEQIAFIERRLRDAVDRKRAAPA